MMAVDWSIAWSDLRELDGDAWDTEWERLRDLWRAQYLKEFVDYALGRSWDRENAEVWSDEIVDDALVECQGDPVEVARKDVHACELE